MNNNTNIDMDQIGIDFKHKSNKKKKCENGNLATIAWVGSLEDGRVVTDTQEEFGSENRTVTIGASMTYACLDYALLQLHSGDEVTVNCPSHLVFGKDDQLSPLNAEIIPKNSKVNFDLTVVKCNFEPEVPKVDKQPVTTTMQPDTCFYLHLVEGDNTGFDLVLSTQDNNESGKWPAKRVIFEDKVRDNE